MPHVFIVPLTQPPSDLIRRAKTLAQENDIVLEGDEQAGSFKGRGVKGEYMVGDDGVVIELIDKPFYVSWSYIESQIREFFA